MGSNVLTFPDRQTLGYREKSTCSCWDVITLLTHSVILSISNKSLNFWLFLRKEFWSRWLISCIANTRTSVPPPSLLNVFLLPCYLPERSTGSCCPAWRPQWRASCPPTTLTCGRGMVACSGCTRTWTTSSAMDWGMSRSAHEAHIDLNNKPFFLF